MDEAVALARLASMVAADQRPALSPADLQDLLDEYRTADADGAWITDPGWVPTWDLNGAAAEGWRRKAARVATDFTFSADGASYDKGEVMAHCLAMAAAFDAKRPPGILGVREDRAAAPYDSPRLTL